MTTLLTDEQIARIANAGQYPISEYVSVEKLTVFARAIEQAALLAPAAQSVGDEDGAAVVRQQ